MERNSLPQKVSLAEGLVTLAARKATGLNVTVVYQDSQTRGWAREVCNRLEDLTADGTPHSTWWHINDLCEPGVLAGAVSTAMRADLVLVAIDTAEGLPMPFYVWVNAWLPHRPHSEGALIALLATPDQPGSHAGRARKFLRAVARKGRLDFLIEERSGSLEPAAASAE